MARTTSFEAPLLQNPISRSAAQASTVRSVVEEYLRGGGASQAASLRDFGDKPLFVLTAGVGSDESWMTAQQKTTTLRYVNPVATTGRWRGLNDDEARPLLNRAVGASQIFFSLALAVPSQKRRAGASRDAAFAA